MTTILTINNKKVTIHIGGIYQHYKGGFYKVREVAFSENNQEPLVVYNSCTDKGIYISYRDSNGNVLVNQPFCRPLKEWVEELKHKDSYGTMFRTRFKLYKEK